MSSIWGFILQTVEVSILAILLIIIKKLFKDKLSSKWQYGVWFILILQLIIPVGIFETYIVPNVAITIETIKTIIERNLISNYIEPYETIKNISVLPIINKMPSSITDILFIIYIVGVIICLGRYLIQYFQIKRILKLGQEDEIITKQVNEIANKYGMKPCKVVLLKEIPTALVFGAVHPILVLPNKEVDEKIILHELFHVKNYDCLQSVIWSILSCLHWCNPIMYFIFKEIKNDMESLCDEYVLEKIEGEQRRDYGRILLNMCSDSYAYAFGTTSISNGSKHIKKRIESIVRFKKYPKGMSLVAICIIVLLIPFAFGGTAQATFSNNLESDSQYQKEYILARARLVKCNTVAGAIDTFVKGIGNTNQEYIMAITTNENRKDFDEYYQSLPFETKVNEQNHQVVNHYNELIDYHIVNLHKTNQGYEGIIALLRYGTFKDATRAYIFDFIPVEIIKEDGYKVKIIGNITVNAVTQNKTDDFYDLYEGMTYKTMYVETKTGNLDIDLYRTASVEQLSNKNDNNFLFDFYDEYLNKIPNPNAQFKDIQLKGEIIYYSNLEDVFNIGIASAPVSVEFDDFSEYQGDVGGGSSTGWEFQFRNVDETWNQQVKYLMNNNFLDQDFKLEDYKFRIYKNHKIVDEFVVELGD